MLFLVITSPSAIRTVNYSLPIEESSLEELDSALKQVIPLRTLKKCTSFPNFQTPESVCIINVYRDSALVSLYRFEGAYVKEGVRILNDMVCDASIESSDIATFLHLNNTCSTVKNEITTYLRTVTRKP